MTSKPTVVVARKKLRVPGDLLNSSVSYHGWNFISQTTNVYVGKTELCH